MSQRINHRREGKRYQDNGSRYENGNPMAGCNSTHVARSRRGWRNIRRRKERRQEYRAIETQIEREGLEL
jgi:hypothetical protein